MFPLYDENRSRTLPIVTWVLIIINAYVFWWELTMGFSQRIFQLYGVIPASVLQGSRLLTLITSMFLHADLWHILGNMLYLFIFGDNVEDRFGHINHLLLYLTFGVVGGLAHSIAVVSAGGLEAFIPTIGASGAVSGILGAYLVFFPRARIMSIVPSFFFVRLARVPAVIFIGFWFILQLLYSTGLYGDAAVAYIAHVAGFVSGFIVAVIVKFRNRNTVFSL
jgi:membrane associated rhomboid family serine protease